MFLVEDKDKGIELDGEDGCPRGEILVHTNKVVQRYSGGRGETGVTVEGYSYFRPGDVCETSKEDILNAEWSGCFDARWGDNLSGRRGVLLRTGARLEVVGRTKNVIKLNNGEFVSPEHIEKTLHGVAADIVDQMIVVVRGQDILALVVPKDLSMAAKSTTVLKQTSLEMKLLNDFKNEGATRGLSVYEIPKAVAVVGRRWTVDNKTMIVSNKVNRHRIQLECDNHLRRIVERLGEPWELREEGVIDLLRTFSALPQRLMLRAFCPKREC